MVGVLLASLGINDNKIISGILNCSLSPSKLWYMLNKAHENTFMRVAGFACNYPCSMSCDKVDRTGIGCLVKDIYFLDGSLLQAIRIDADASKGISKELSKALVVSLNHIDTQRSYGGRTLVLGKTTDSGGDGGTESLVG